MLSVSLKAQTPAEIDADAEEYASIAVDVKYDQANGTTAVTQDAEKVQRIHQWYSGLKNLNLYTNLFFAATFRQGYNTILPGGSVYGMYTGGNPGVLPQVTLNGQIEIREDGFMFDGDMTRYLQIANPIKGTAISEFTVMMVFQASSLLPNYCLYSGSDYAGTAGPALYINGHGATNNSWGDAYSYYSNNGSSTTYMGIQNAVNGGPQVMFQSYSPTYGAGLFVSGVQSFTANPIGTIHNNNNYWRIGRDFDRPSPGPFGFQGLISGFFVWKRDLTWGEKKSVQMLYNRTLGAGFMPRVNAYLIADDETFGSGLYHWAKHLSTNQVWSYVSRYNAAGNQLNAGNAQGILNTVAILQPAASREIRQSALSWYMSLCGVTDLYTKPQLIEGVTYYGEDPSKFFPKILASWNYARQIGLKVVAFTIPYSYKGVRTPVNLSTSEAFLRWQKFNDMIRANSGSYSVLVELDKINEMKISNETQASLAYYNANPALQKYWDSNGAWTSEAHRLFAAKIVETIGNPYKP